MDYPLPDINLRDISKLTGELPDSVDGDEIRNLFNRTIDKISRNKSGSNLAIGTFCGWLTGVIVMKIGRIAAFGLGGGIILLHFANDMGYIDIKWERITETMNRSHESVERVVNAFKSNSCCSMGFVGGFFFVQTTRSTPPTSSIEKPTDLSINNYDDKKPTGKAAFTDKTAFLPKPLPHSPKISPSSIPNPNPSVTAIKQLESSYPSYNNYLFSIPGYSAFQPVTAPTNHAKPSETANQSTNTDFIHFPVKKPPPPKTIDLSNKPTRTETNTDKNTDVIIKTDFEDKFTTEIVTSITTTEGVESSKLNITSLRQGSGATVTIPSQIELKKKTERFSLKTSIPISKIDMKCVNPNDNSNHKNVPKKPIPFNPAFQSVKPDSRVEIQSNVVIKCANSGIDETKDSSQSKNINALIDAAEAIHKNETSFWNKEPNNDIKNDAKDLPKVNSSSKPFFNPIQLDTKINFVKKPPDGAKTDTTNQIVLIQNKANNNPKMLVALTQQQNNSQPQVLSQKTADSKNLQAPSRPSNVNKNCKDELIKETGSSKVVSLKRLHHENCDEDDFENLITENQIYGNKIVVKERSQGTLQEQDLKPRTKPTDGKNMVLQPNFLYVSNVQFPANVMMIKNSNKDNQNITEQLKNNNRIDNTTNNNYLINTNDTKQIYTKTTSNIVVSKDNIHVLKSNNSVLQTIAPKPNKQDVLFQTNQNMIMNPQIIYQVPMLVEGDSQKLGPTFLNQSYSKLITQKKEMMKEQQTKQNEKLYIACPYQMDSKLQPKILITNIRPQQPKKDEISTLDIYEKRRKMRQLRNLNNRKNTVKTDPRKVENRGDFKNIITADNMKDEMSKEFAKTKIIYESSISDSESDYERDELKDYADVIKKYSKKKKFMKGYLEIKKSFLSIFKLGTHNDLKEKNLQKRERVIQHDAVAKACIAAGRLDMVTPIHDQYHKDKPKRPPKPEKIQGYQRENKLLMMQQVVFLDKLDLARATPRYREDYEKAWQEVIKERQRRNGLKTTGNINKTKAKPNAINPNDQLKLLSDMKNTITENNNLIKRRLDTEKANSCESDSICAMAEKSFSELTRLSKLADISVQILSGNDTRKRDLNPGFDSERIQNPAVTKANESQFHLNIPDIAEVKTRIKQYNNELSVLRKNSIKTPATSIDEPSNCAAFKLNYRAFNHIEIVPNDDYYNICSDDEKKSETKEIEWPGIDSIEKSYRVFNAARTKEIEDLQNRNKQLQASWEIANQTATREAEVYNALYAERQSLANEEDGARHALIRLYTIVNKVRIYRRLYYKNKLK